MTYSTDQDVFNAFGESNVRKWADVNNNKLEPDITARLLWGHTAASGYLDSKLSRSPYQFPLADISLQPNAAFDTTLVLMDSYLVGVLLYESRGVTDVGPHGQAMHNLRWHRERVEEFIRDVFARRITLAVTLRADAVQQQDLHEAPEMVHFKDPGMRRPVPFLGDDFISMTRPTD